MLLMNICYIYIKISRCSLHIIFQPFVSNFCCSVYRLINMAIIGHVLHVSHYPDRIPFVFKFRIKSETKFKKKAMSLARTVKKLEQKK